MIGFNLQQNFSTGIYNTAHSRPLVQTNWTKKSITKPPLCSDGNSSLGSLPCSALSTECEPQSVEILSKHSPNLKVCEHLLILQKPENLRCIAFTSCTGCATQIHNLETTSWKDKTQCWIDQCRRAGEWKRIARESRFFLTKKIKFL